MPDDALPRNPPRPRLAEIRSEPGGSSQGLSRCSVGDGALDQRVDFSVSAPATNDWRIISQPAFPIHIPISDGALNALAAVMFRAALFASHNSIWRCPIFDVAGWLPR